MPDLRRATRSTALLTSCLIGSLVLVQLWGDADMLAYDRSRVLAGEWWRLITGHLVHAGATHLALNALGLILLCSLSRSSLVGWSGLLWLLWLALGTAGLLMLTLPEVQWYVGLSGVVHGVAVLAAWDLISERRSVGWVLLCGLVLKLLWEVFAHPAATAQLIGIPVIDAAHRYGAGTALLGLAIRWPFSNGARGTA